MFPKAVLRPHGDKWLVVITDTDLKAIYTDLLPRNEAQAIADEYNQRTVVVHRMVRILTPGVEC